MKTQILRILAVFLIGAATVSGCGTAKTDAIDTANPDILQNSEKADFVYRVGFVNIADSDPNCFAAQQKFVEGVQSDEFKAKIGTDRVEAVTADSDFDIEKQITNIETMLTKGVDAIFLIGVDTEGNTAAVEQCNAEGVPVFMVGTEAAGGKWQFIGFNESELGKKQGEWCAANLPENANICYLQGTPGREAAMMREEGFRSGLASRGDLNILSAQTGNFETAAAMQVTEDWIQSYGDKIDSIVSADSQMIGGAIEALKAANMTDVITCGVVHLGTWDADYIRNGTESYAVYVGWPDIGTLCADVAANVYLGNPLEEKTYITLYDVTTDNYTDYFAE